MNRASSARSACRGSSWRRWAFSRRIPNPTRAELAHGISGNLCRCQDYDKILTAMMRGAENMRKGVIMALPPNEHKLIGKNYPTPDLVAKVTGKVEIRRGLSRRRHAVRKLLLSPMPHARVRSIDTSAALAMPGVKAILTADDLPAPADSLTDNGHRDQGQQDGRSRAHQ